MEFQKKKYTFRGMDGFAGFRHGQEYELDIAASEPTDDQPVEVVVINPVSQLYSYFSKQAFTETWKKER